MPGARGELQSGFEEIVGYNLFMGVRFALENDIKLSKNSIQYFEAAVTVNLTIMLVATTLFIRLIFRNFHSFFNLVSN